MAKKKVITLALLAAIFLGFIFVPGYLKIRKLNSQKQDLERKITEIEALNSQLQEEQELLINDPLYLEQVARRKLGVVREGEVIYKVLPPPDKQ